MTNTKPKSILIKSNVDGQETKDVYNKSKGNFFLNNLFLLVTVTPVIYFLLYSTNMNQFSSCCFSIIITQIIYLLYK